MEAWEKVLLGDKYFDKDVHSQIGCIECHGGVPDTDDKEEAHVGVVAKVSADPMKACGSCHPEYAERSQDNIHRLQTGYIDVLEHRGADFTDPTTVQAYGNHCTSCHADCGDCHISRPSALGGGLISGHQVKKVASVWLTCGGCHSTRIADDYRGNHEGIPGDVHWQKQGMACTKCHDANDYHDSSHGTRYDGAPSPACTDCHEDVTAADAIDQHDADHLDKMACQTCHAAGAYKNCYGCHTGIDSKDIKYFSTEPSEMDFKIGLNPEITEDRPWEYVMVRHAPSTVELFDFYGEGLLPEFDAVPTWKYTTPHNMQRNTPQNSACNNCHGQSDLFLLEDDVRDYERAANAPVIVPPDRVPELLEGYPLPGEEDEGEGES